CTPWWFSPKKGCRSRTSALRLFDLALFGASCRAVRSGRLRPKGVTMLRARVISFTQRTHPPSQLPSATQTIVLIGRDLELLGLRAKLISSAGFVVQSMTPG